MTVREGCGHPMRAGESACRCTTCGVVCQGQFAGCATVWAKGPQDSFNPPDEGLSSRHDQSGLFPLDAAAVMAESESMTDQRDLFPLDAAAVVTESGSMTEPSDPFPLDAAAVVTESEPTVEHREPFPPAPAAVVNSARTAWPSPATGRRVSPGLSNGGPQRIERRVAPPGPIPEPQSQAAPVLRTDEERGQVFEWLQDSFDGLRSQLRVLNDAVSRQQDALGSLGEAEAIAERLAMLADVLPERIGDAVQEALASHPQAQGNGSVRGDVEVDEMVDVRDGNGSSGDDPRPADEAPPVAVAPPPPPAPERVAAPEPADAPVGEEDAAHGVRTQLNALASTVQSRLNRSGWQEKLRSLSTR